MPLQKYYLAVVLLILQFIFGDCCSCLPMHPQEAFCKADYAIKAIVISEAYKKPLKNKQIFQQLGLPEPNYRYYDVLVTKVLKGTNITSEHSTFAAFFKKTIRTPLRDALCSVQLKKDETYLITGRILNGELHTGTCDWVENYKDLPHRMERRLDGQFDCGCKVATCIGDYCENDSLCKWESNDDHTMDECTEKHRVCRKVIDQCHWVDDNKYDLCRKKTTLETIFP